MKNVSFGVVFLLVAGLIWFALREDARLPAAVPSAPEAAAETSAPSRADAMAESPTESPQAERSEVESTSASSALAVTLKGRCVDGATRAPLAGCTVEVDGWAGNESRMAAYLESHAKIEWNAPAAHTTGPDGAFAFTFVPPPPYVFGLHLRAPGRVRLSAHWDRLEPGTVVDFGDVAIDRGSTVSGVVADSNGVPQGDVRVYLDRDDRGPHGERLASSPQHRTQSGADGTFVFGEPVRSFAWNVRLRGRQKVSPASLEIPQGETFTTLLIETRPLGGVETISGVVVDETGAPVGAVEVRYEPSRGVSELGTESDGTFVIERRDGDPEGPIRLQLDRDGYEYVTSAEGYAWGTDDVRLVMKRGLSVEVVVTDGDTGEPIEDYAVRCFPEAGTRSRQIGRDYEVKNSGHHLGGQTTVEGITRGPAVLVVEPAGDTWPISDFVRFEVTDAGAPRQEVKLFRIVSQTLRVLRAGGEPVAGTAVELLRPVGAIPVSTSTYPLTMQNLMNYNLSDRAVLLMKGTTDAQGELLVSGPPRTALALRMLGPGHQPWCEPEMTLVEGAPLVVTVPGGATVFGRIGPARFLDEVRPSDARYAPGIEFQRELAGRRERHPRDDAGSRGITMNEDGTFRATGVPPGDWSVFLRHWNRNSNGRGWSGKLVLVQAIAGLREGEERELNADLSHLLPGTVSGTVIYNGEPLANGGLQLVGRRPDDRGGVQPSLGPSAKTGADGTFSLQADPGTYGLNAWVRPASSGDWLILPADEEITLAPGQRVDQVFHARTGALRIRVLRSNGEPAPGVVVHVANLDETWTAPTPATDGDGWTTLEAGPRVAIQLTAVPKRLLDPKARQEFFDANQNAPLAWRDVMLKLGRAEIKAGTDPAVVEVRLPASSDY